MKQCKVSQIWKRLPNFSRLPNSVLGIDFRKLPRRSSRFQGFYDQVSHSNEPRLCDQVHGNKWPKSRNRFLQTWDQWPTKVSILKTYDENYLIHNDFTEIFFILGGKTLRIPTCFSTMTDTPWHFLDFLLIATWKFSVRKRAKYFIKTSLVSLCIKHWKPILLNST